MASSAAIVHQILQSEAVHSHQQNALDHTQAQTRVLRAILRIMSGMETAWSRVVRHRSI